MWPKMGIIQVEGVNVGVHPVAEPTHCWHNSASASCTILWQLHKGCARYCQPPQIVSDGASQC